MKKMIFRRNFNYLLGLLFFFVCINTQVFPEGDELLDLGELEDVISEPEAEEAGTLGNPLVSVRSPRHRDIFYLLPTNHPFMVKDRKGHFFLKPFYNKASRMEYLSEKIDRLTTMDFIKTVVPPAERTKINSIIDTCWPIFERFTTQERKAGMIGSFYFPFKKWNFEFELPLLLSIRNLWLPETDQKLLRKTMRAMVPASGPLTPEQFEAELAQTPYRVGLGDTHLKFGFIPIKSQVIVAQLGVQVIVPTSRFFNPVRRTQTDAQAAVQFKDIVADQSDENFRKMFYQTVDTLQGISLRPSLGVGHAGVGCFVNTYIPIFEDVFEFWTRSSFDSFLKAQELRYIISDLHTFPQEKKLKVNPGSIFHTVVGADLKGAPWWRLGAYYDFYFQCQERLVKAYIGTEYLPHYKVTDVIRPSATQQKLGGALTFFSHGWELAVGGERVVNHERIGRGWSVFSEFSYSF